MPGFISVSHFTHILTHTYMAWKSVMSSTSHHALFLCSGVSEANGNSSFPPSTPTLTFILSFFLSFSPHPHPLHCGAALICIEQEHPSPPPPPQQDLKFPPFFLPLHLNSLLLSLLVDFTCFHSHHLFSASFRPYFTFSDCFFPFFPSDLQLTVDILPISPSYSLPSVPASHCTDQSISISRIPSLLSSILSWIRNKTGSHYPSTPPHQHHHHHYNPPTQLPLQLPTGPGWLIFLRRSVSN